MVNIKYQNFSLTNNSATPILAEIVDARDSVILDSWLRRTLPYVTTSESGCYTEGRAVLFGGKQRSRTPSHF